MGELIKIGVPYAVLDEKLWLLIHLEHLLIVCAPETKISIDFSYKLFHFLA